MPQSLSRVLVHLVFSTKNRQPFIRPEHREALFAYLAGALRGMECPVTVVGGHLDHVHLLFAQARTLAMSEIVEGLKKESSKWAKPIIDPGFYWQSGYGAFSVSASNEIAVAEYIRDQEHHHRTRSFQDEYRTLLRKYGIDWDERYVWD